MPQTEANHIAGEWVTGEGEIENRNQISMPYEAPHMWDLFVSA